MDHIGALLPDQVTNHHPAYEDQPVETRHIMDANVLVTIIILVLKNFNGCNSGYTEENGSCILMPVVKTCVVYDVLYNDLKCYIANPSGKTAIGVVFDTTNKLAIKLTYRDGNE